VTLYKAILRDLTVRLALDGYLRIMPHGQRTTPLGMGHGKSRFSSSDDRFTLLYAARDLPTALAERIIRDRFQGRERRKITTEEIENFVVADISTRMPLRLVDLRTSGASRLGIPTDAVRGRAQQAGRRFSQQLYDSTDFDGIVYMSRITNAECVAVYDRAVKMKLDPACPVEDLVKLTDLDPALNALNIHLVRDYNANFDLAAK
jgi:hypothetical protein